MWMLIIMIKFLYKLAKKKYLVFQHILPHHSGSAADLLCSGWRHSVQISSKLQHSVNMETLHCIMWKNTHSEIIWWTNMLNNLPKFPHVPPCWIVVQSRCAGLSSFPRVIMNCSELCVNTSILRSLSTLPCTLYSLTKLYLWKILSNFLKHRVRSLA